MNGIPSYTVVGLEDAQYTLCLLHGILGSNRNWRSFARRLVAARPEWQAVLVDLRCHGESTHLAPPHSLTACANDLIRLEAALDRPFDLVIGHSFGGKVALEWGQLSSHRLVSTFVLDSPPGATSTRVRNSLASDTGGRLDTDTSAVERVISVIGDVPMPVSDRRDVSQFLEQQGFSRGLAAWMTTNVRREGSALHWAFDLDGVVALLADYREQDYWDLVEHPPDGLYVTQVWAAQSDRWLADDLAQLRNIEHPQSRVVSLDKAGHWLHVDNAAGLLEILDRGLEEIEQRKAKPL